MKKLVPILFLIIAFTGFLSTQILWDEFHLNAEQDSPDKQKYSIYENNFQALKLTTTKGTNIELRNSSSPIVVLNFWASWCQPCLREFPSLTKFQEKFKDKVLVLGINGDEEDPLKNLIKTEQKYALNFESVLDSKGTVANKFMVNTMPTSIIFLRGKVIYVNKKIHDFMAPDFLTLIEENLK